MNKILLKPNGHAGEVASDGWGVPSHQYFTATPNCGPLPEGDPVVILSQAQATALRNAISDLARAHLTVTVNGGAGWTRHVEPAIYEIIRLTGIKGEDGDV